MLNRLLEDASKPGKGQREKSGTKPPDSTRRSSTAREVGEGVGAMTGAGERETLVQTGRSRLERAGLTPGVTDLFFSHGAKASICQQFPGCVVDLARYQVWRNRNKGQSSKKPKPKRKGCRCCCGRFEFFLKVPGHGK